MDRLRVVLLGCGITLFGLLLIRIGPQPIVDAFARLSWSVLLVVWFPFVLINVCDTLGWQFAFPRQCVPFRALFRARLAGEAFNATTPGASVAGEPVKAALIRRHVDYHESAASLVVAKTTITISQVLFLAFGLAVVRRAGVDPRLFHALLIALAVETVVTSGFVAVQTTRVLGVISALLMRLGLTGLAHGSVTADIAIKRYYRRHPGALALSIGFHFLGWLLSAGETYLILRLLGVHVTLPFRRPGCRSRWSAACASSRGSASASSSSPIATRPSSTRRRWSREPEPCGQRPREEIRSSSAVAPSSPPDFVLTAWKAWLRRNW